jgi:hypothetical protein
MKPILCVDFDGVIHSYTSGWHGAGVISDPPVKGAIDFLRLATDHFRVAIYSTRSNYAEGIETMQLWLRHWAVAETKHLPDVDFGWLLKIEWPTKKPPALVTLDDRALTFTGEWPPMETLQNFKPWNKR